MTQPDLFLPDEDDPPYHYRLVIERSGKEWLTENKRYHHMARARIVRNWRDIAAWRAHRALVPMCLRAHIIAELRFQRPRKRDANNWAPTAKAIVDGLVDAHVFPDDDSTRVVGPDMRMGPADPVEQIIMHIWPLPPLSRGS